MPHASLNRRSVLKGAASLVGGLVIGFHATGLPAHAQAPAVPPVPPPNAWLRIARDGTVTITSNATELGQGSMSVVAQLIVEELDVPWSSVRVVMGEPVPAMAHPFFGGMGTGGSATVVGQFDHLRRIGAAARRMLEMTAASVWSVPVTECLGADGKVKHTGSRRELPYGRLADAAMRLAVPTDVPLRPATAYRHVGQPRARLDIPDKVTGKAVYGMDVRLPGLLTATIRQCPVPGGRLLEVDEAPALAVPGVHKVVRLPDAVAVVATGYWPAAKGLDLLAPRWDEGPLARWSDPAIAAVLADALANADAKVELTGDGAPKPGAVRTVTAAYDVPYLAHAAMEPLTAVVHVRESDAEIWVSAQFPVLVAPMLAPMLGLPPDRIRVHTLPCGGSFGRRVLQDYIAQAALIAKAAGAPVKLIWSREEDIRHDIALRPPAVASLSLVQDKDGQPLSFAARLASPSAIRAMPPYFPPMMQVKDGVDRLSVEGINRTVYALGDRDIRYRDAEVRLPTGPWRSVGNSHNLFFLESFIDEAAHAAGLDPLAYRRQLLASRPRHLRVLERAAEAAGWGRPLPPGRFHGLAIGNPFRSVVAQVAEISVTGDRLRVHRVVCAVDCGTVVNPDNARAQVEGGILFGLSAALSGEINWDAGRVRQSNFDDHPVLRLADAPMVETHFVEAGEALGGLGEPSTALVAPAVCNAIFAATGKRIRSLPIVKAGFTVA